MRTNSMVSIVSVVGIAMIVLAPAAFAQGMKWRSSGGRAICVAALRGPCKIDY